MLLCSFRTCVLVVLRRCWQQQDRHPRELVFERQIRLLASHREHCVAHRRGPAAGARRQEGKLGRECRLSLTRLCRAAALAAAAQCYACCARAARSDTQRRSSSARAVSYQVKESADFVQVAFQASTLLAM
eukprot:Amastigsp_a842064_437.p2 type:complete len:131 gc:universal Amastigsp_a842064_437:440-832(+)